LEILLFRDKNAWEYQAKIFREIIALDISGWLYKRPGHGLKENVLRFSKQRIYLKNEKNKPFSISGKSRSIPIFTLKFCIAKSDFWQTGDVKYLLKSSRKFNFDSPNH
jgi:hypothetical protein